MRFRKGDHLPDRRGANQQGDQAVDPWGDPSVGRSSKTKGLQEKSKAGPDFVRRKTKDAEDRLLDLGLVDSDGAGPKLHPIDHQVIRAGPNLSRILLQKRQVLLKGSGKGVMLRIPALGFLVIPKQGKVGHPNKVEAPLRSQIEPLGQVDP